MTREPKAYKRLYDMNTKSKFNDARDTLNSVLLRVPREERSEAWESLYFAQPNTSEAQLRGFETKARAYLAELECDSIRAAVTAREVGQVILLGTLARGEALLKKSAKPARRVADTGRYQYPTAPVRLFAPGNAEIAVGSVLLLTYGPRGTQPFAVKSIEGNRLEGFRLFSRGTRFAGWEPSSIQRHDRRILGEAALVPADPAIPA